MVKKIELDFPDFITHVPQSKNKWLKIGYNKIYASAHYTVRHSFVAAMHKYLEKHIPDNLSIDGPVTTELTVYVPINYGNVKRLKDKKTGKYYINWKPARDDYEPTWDIGNLAMVWLKCIDDMLVKKGLFPDDNVKYLRGSSYEFREVATLRERKLVYKVKTIE